jgi:hypothetical protein
MEWEHDIKNGDRVYMYPVRYDEEHARNQGKLQAYFYRAMAAAEAAGWQAIASAPRSERASLYRKTGALAVQGHQGWASHRKYSRKYLKDDFTRLLEVHAPGFIETLDEIGVSSGKAEDGDISWGMGLTCSNGFHPSHLSGPGSLSTTKKRMACSFVSPFDSPTSSRCQRNTQRIHRLRGHLSRDYQSVRALKFS